LQLKEAIEDGDSTFHDYAAIIGNDPAMVARLLKIVNSPIYGYPTQIETIQHALTIVGVTQLSELVLATAVLNQFQGIPSRLLNVDTFWEHCLTCGIASKILAGYLHEAEVDRLNVAGMLHDIGRLVICKKAPKQAELIFYLCETREELICKVEKEVMGFDHADVGASLLKAWKLPPRLVEVVAYSHFPERSKNFPVDVAIVHVADILSYQLQLGGSGERIIPMIDNTVWERTRLTPEMVESAQEDLRKLLEEQVDAIAGSG
jgi:putative nucleotidyltransferase with HDIG domain